MKIEKLNLDGKKDSIEVLDKICSAKINKKLVNSVLYKPNANLILACDTFRNSVFYSFQNQKDKNFKNKIEIRNFDNLMKIDDMYTDNNIFIVGDASIKVFQELKNNGLSVNKAKKAWDLYDETGLKSLVKIALEKFNNNILICDPVYISEPITKKKKNKN